MEAPTADSPFQLIMKFDETNGLTETARKNRQTVLDAYQAQLDGDLEAWWSIFDKDVLFYEADSLPYGGVYTGLAAARAGCDGMFANWSKLHVTIEELAAGKDIVFAYIQMSATARATGKSCSFPVAELFRFKNGKVIEWRPIYYDTHLALRVSGAI